MARTDSPSSVFDPANAAQTIEYYYEQDLTDGLPVVPPNPELVQQFLEAGEVEPKEVLGTRPSRRWVATAEKVAINAVMAGCMPEYAPVVLAMVRGFLEPEFNASAMAETASTSAPMVLINGPVRQRLNINSSWNLFGPGHRANATIGRALRLVLMNILNVKPGVTEMSNFGHTGRFTFCVGENEESSPWEPYHVERGFSLESSTVSLFSVCHPIEAPNWIDHHPEGILETISHIIASFIRCHGYVIVILGPEHAHKIAGAGWDKAKVKTHIADRVAALRPVVAFDQERVGALGGAWFPGVDDPENSTVPTTPETITVLVAGGEGGGHSTVLPTWSMGLTTKSVIKSVG